MLTVNRKDWQEIVNELAIKEQSWLREINKNYKTFERLNVDVCL